MAGPRSTDGASPADTAATLREREHALRNELFALTLRTDLASEEVPRRRDELNRRLAHGRELLARSETLARRAGHGLRDLAHRGTGRRRAAPASDLCGWLTDPWAAGFLETLGARLVSELEPARGMDAGRWIVSCQHCHQAVAFVPRLGGDDLERLRAHLLTCRTGEVINRPLGIQSLLEHFRVESADPKDKPPNAA